MTSRLNSVQMPLNLMDAHYDSFEKKVLPVLVEHNIGVLGMKSMGEWVDSEEQNGDAGGVPALCHEPADQRSHHRMRLDGNSQAGVGRGPQL